MAQTSVSSATAYASWSDLVACYDARQIGDLIRDDDTREPISGFAANTALQAALKWGSGEVEMACFSGGRYSAADLAALTGVGAQALKGLVCDLAMWRLRYRRHVGRAEEGDLPKMSENVLQKLEALRNGHVIFGFAETVDASSPETVPLTTDSTGVPKRITSIAGRYFGRRSDDPSGT